METSERPTALCTSRLSKELRRISRDPVPNADVAPDPSNITDLHFVIRGLGAPFDGGFYHGVLRFPYNYPMRPPVIMMFTPSGRFTPSTPLCLSISSFHPESWNPMWSVSSIIVGLTSFMQEEAVAVGSIRASARERRALAASSLAYNVRNAKFRELFPNLVELSRRQQQSASTAAAVEVTSVDPNSRALIAGSLRRVASLVALILLSVGLVSTMLFFGGIPSRH